MSKFFINRPIVAIVISIIVVIVGAVTIATLPVAQFPNIVPPEVQVLATYVGADAQTIEQSVATPVEQQMSGVDNTNYMYSLNSTADGPDAPHRGLRRKDRSEYRPEEFLFQSAQDATRLSHMRYTGGVTGYLEVLTNETNAFSAELAVVQARQNELLALVQLYEALGGGWQQ